MLTQRGVEKRQEKELKAAEATQWKEQLDFDALEPLRIEESQQVLRSVSRDRILKSRWAYKDKNWPKRKTEQKCKARLVIAGHTDPDLIHGLTTDAPTLSRPGLLCLLQRLANGLQDEDPWVAAAGDISVAPSSPEAI